MIEALYWIAGLFCLGAAFCLIELVQRLGED